jgi:hypothetical protein
MSHFIFSNMPFYKIPFYSSKAYFLKYPVRWTLWTGFTGLGFYRGWEAQKYMVEYENKRNMERSLMLNNEYIPENFMYSKAFCHGIFGAAVYYNMLFMPFMIGKELYRAEIDFRNLEKTDFYKYILF